MDNSGLNNLGQIRDAAGDVVVEMFGPPNALTEDADVISRCLYSLSETVIRGLKPGSAVGGLGGEFGYGVDFENDVFLMHPFCWCEEESCLWCGGSGCQIEHLREPHRPSCYQVRLDALKRQFGEQLDWTEGEFFHVPFDSPNTEEYEAAKRELCRELKQDYEFGNEVHCTCGVNDEWRARYDACVCDWHLGQGIFRFGAAVSAPHFWHKASGLQIRWYKWIGRDMEMNRESISGQEWSEIFNACLESLPVEAREKAQRDHDQENTPEFLAERQANYARLAEAMYRVLDKEQFQGPTVYQQHEQDRDR